MTVARWKVNWLGICHFNVLSYISEMFGFSRRVQVVCRHLALTSRKLLEIIFNSSFEEDPSSVKIQKRWPWIVPGNENLPWPWTWGHFSRHFWRIDFRDEGLGLGVVGSLVITIYQGLDYEFYRQFVDCFHVVRVTIAQCSGYCFQKWRLNFLKMEKNSWSVGGVI